MGTRMQSAIPKQFLLLSGRPILVHTIEAFYHSQSRPQIIVVLPAEFHSYWKELCREYDLNIQHQLIEGGETRFHSVKNGLEAITDDEALIAVQDAVRPLTDKQIIDNSYLQAAEQGNAITAIKSRDSVRQMKNGVSTSLARDDIYLVQTPQTFRSSQLRKAYTQPYRNEFTDDASVVEAAGFEINLIGGSPRNIKITFPEDIAIAEWFMADRP